MFLITKILGEQQLTETILPFTNGVPALQYLSESAQDICKLPDVILLDIKMPEISGWQFLQQLKEINFIEAYKPALCIISADMHFDSEMLQDEPLIKAHLVKPISQAKLVALFKYNCETTAKSGVYCYLFMIITRDLILHTLLYSKDPLRLSAIIACARPGITLS